MLQDSMDKLQSKGLNSAQLDQAEKFTRFMLGPAVQGVWTLIAGLILGFIIALIVAAFLKRPAPAGPPPV